MPAAMEVPNVDATPGTSIQRRNNVVCPVGGLY